jgi:hypothetical protein
MKTLAKKRSTSSTSSPSLVPRVEALIKDVFAAPSAERIAALEAWESSINDYLDCMAEQTRPPSIPGPWLRLQFDARGYGNNPTRALIQASKCNA